MNPHSFSRNYSTGLAGYNRPAIPSMDNYGYGNNGSLSTKDENHGRGGDRDGSRHEGSSRAAVPQAFPASGPTGKRGSRACVACRKGKNRCEWDPASSKQTCRRCMLNGIQCVFEKASDRREGRGRSENAAGGSWNGDAEGRVTNLEKSVQELANGQNQIQTALQQILSMLPQSAPAATPSSLQTFVPPSDSSSITPIAHIFNSSTTPPSVFSNTSPAVAQHHAGMMFAGSSSDVPRSPQNTASGRRTGDASHLNDEAQAWPKLPGFAPPNHRFGTYGIIPLSSAPPSPNHSRSSRASSVNSTSSDAAVPPSSMVAPIQALQTLANAADQAAALANGGGSENPTDEPPSDTSASHRASDEGTGVSSFADRPRNRKRKRVTIGGGRTIHLRVKKQTKPDPTPRNPFPDVVTKGLVSETEARELWDIFFSGCHYFVPLWDKKYDTYETFIERTPFSTNGLLAVAAKIRAGNGPLGQTFHRCLEEAQGIARSTLFGPIVRKEAVLAMLILSVWSQYSWLPCGHALRMGLDMNLHRALDKLVDSDEQRTESEERDLVVSARIWLNCYLHEQLSSLGTGKPILLRDDSSVRAARVLLSHPMVSETDASLVARVELVGLRVRILDHLTPLHGKADSDTINFVRTVFGQMQDWYQEWYDIHRTRYDEDSVLVRLLEADLVYAQLWTVCVALRGCQWDKLSDDQRELAFEAKDAALRCVQVFLHSKNFRSHLKYATHDQLATVAFAAVFLLKIAMLYPSAISLPTLNNKVSEIAHVLSAECFAERYALTLKLMLSNFRRKTGAISTVPGTPRGGHYLSDTLPTNPSTSSEAVGDLAGGLQSLLSLPAMGDGLGDGMGGDTWPVFSDTTDGFAWPNEFSPSNLPDWLQDNNFADLGLPVDGSDSLFLPLELANMFLPSGTTSNANYQFTLPDSIDVGAEAW
ncbi:hypothetical protein Q8F55_008817 [Vanrija albida]|uniref:Zn(2)-C6 fungal-type domain-containing protein n=1 Tax=Vanrija albida TaxID=181172 RepID=A0ABR3PRW6_9TREE